MNHQNTQKKQRILILSDSLALPRHTPENVLYEDTWVELLKSSVNNAVIHQLSIGGATIDKLWAQFFYHKNFRPDVCIIQCGIVDCSPRAFTEFEQYVINSNRITRKIGNIVIPRIKSYLRKNRYLQLTSPSNYHSYFSRFKAEGIKLMAIGIIPACEKYNKKVPGIAENVCTYNNILLEIFGENFIDTSDIKEDMLMSDFHHLNNKGHEMLFNKIRLKLESLY